MISSNDLRPGITVELDGMVWQCVEFQHVKPGKGAAFVRAKLKNLQTGSVVERKFNAGIKLQNASRCSIYMKLTVPTASWIPKHMNRLC